MTEKNTLVQNVIKDAERVTELLGGNSELQQKFAFIKANAQTACNSISQTTPVSINGALLDISTSDVTITSQKEKIINALATIIAFLKTGINSDASIK